MSEDYSKGRLLAFVRAVQHGFADGPILYADGSFAEEVRAGSYDLDDHQVPPPQRTGLLVLDGHCEFGVGPDPDVYFKGKWRELTVPELCAVRRGNDPWPAS